MQDAINKALNHLSNLDYPSYYKIMDTIVPNHLWSMHQTNKMKYISGNAPWDFNQQLEAFTKEIARVVIDENTNTPPSNQHINLIIKRIDKIKANVSKDKLEEALKALETLSEEILNARYNSEVILMIASFNGNEDGRRNQIITDQFYISQRVKTRMNILYILKQMKNDTEDPW